MAATTRLPVHHPYKAPSASNAEAFVMCGASHILPQSDRGGDYRDRGTEAHEALAAFINGRMPVTTLRGVQSVRDFNIGEVIEGVEDPEAEVAYAVNVKHKTVRRIGKDLGRNYGPLEKYEVPCTIDVLGRRKGRPFVRDWKFGTYGSWWQLLVQGMALAYGAIPDDEPAMEIDAGFVFIDANTNGAFYFEEKKTLTLEEIDQACDAIFSAWDRVEKAAADYAETGKAPPQAVGPWCKYCNAFTSCPAQFNLVGAMLGRLGDLETKLPSYTPQELGKAWEVYKAARDQLDRIGEAIKGAALHESIPLPSGKFLSMIECSGRVSVDKETAYATIKRLGGTDADCDAIMKRGRPYLTSKETRKA